MHNTEKDETKLRAADMLYKRLGAYVAQQSQTTHNHLTIKTNLTKEQMRGIAQIEAMVFQQL
jgi:hypothetical protein